MKKILRWALIAIAAAFVVAQFIRPPVNSAAADPASDFIALNHPPPEVENALRVEGGAAGKIAGRWEPGNALKAGTIVPTIRARPS